MGLSSRFRVKLEDRDPYPPAFVLCRMVVGCVSTASEKAGELVVMGPSSGLGRHPNLGPMHPISMGAWGSSMFAYPASPLPRPTTRRRYLSGWLGGGAGRPGPQTMGAWGSSKFSHTGPGRRVCKNETSRHMPAVITMSILEAMDRSYASPRLPHLHYSINCCQILDRHDPVSSRNGCAPG